MKRLIRFVFALSLSALAATAGAAALEFRVLGWNAPVADLFFSSAGREVSITAETAALSSVHTFNGNGVLQLYRRDSSQKRVPAADISIPPGLTRAILLLQVGADGSCSGKWIDDSAESTPAGTMRIHNLAGKSVALSVGKDAVRTLEPGADTLAHLPSNTRAIPVRVAALIGEQWASALNISQPVRSRLRFQVFIRDARPTLENPDAILDWVVFHETPPRQGP